MNEFFDQLPENWKNFDDESARRLPPTHYRRNMENEFLRIRRSVVNDLSQLPRLIKAFLRSGRGCDYEDPTHHTSSEPEDWYYW